MTATIPRVSRPRGVLSENEEHVVANMKAAASRAQDEYRSYCVFLLVERGRSFAEVSKSTGLSTNTLQRWKREAGK